MDVYQKAVIRDIKKIMDSDIGSEAKVERINDILSLFELLTSGMEQEAK